MCGAVYNGAVGAHIVRPPFFATIPVGAGVLTRLYKPSPWGEGAPVHTLGRMRGQVPAPLHVGAHIVRPPFFAHNPCRGGCPHPPVARRPLCRARRPGLPRFRRRGGTLGRPPSNRRTPPQFPIYVSKRPTKDQIPPHLNGPKAFPPQGGRWLAAGQTDEGDLREAQHSPQSPSSVSLTADSFPLEGGSLFAHASGQFKQGGI